MLPYSLFFSQLVVIHIYSNYTATTQDTGKHGITKQQKNTAHAHSIPRTHVKPH